MWPAAPLQSTGSLFPSRPPTSAKSWCELSRHRHPSRLISVLESLPHAFRRDDPTMQLETILTPERCFYNLEGASKKGFLPPTGERMADTAECLPADQTTPARPPGKHRESTGTGTGT